MSGLDSTCVTKTCSNSKVEGSSYCQYHRTTRGAKKEVQVQTETREYAAKSLGTKSDENSALSRVLYRMLDGLQEVTMWTDETREKMDALHGEWRYQNSKGDEQLRSEVQIYERALDRQARVLRDMAKLDIDARVAGIEKKQAEFMLMVLVRAMDHVGIEQNVANQVIQQVGKELRDG